MGEPLEEDRVGGRENSHGTVIASKMRDSDMEGCYKEAQRRTAKVWPRVDENDKGGGQPGNCEITLGPFSFSISEFL